MKTQCIMIVSILLILISGCTSNPQEVTKCEMKELPNVSIDSLSKLNINITLWAESKENYETLAHDTLKRVGWVRCEFIADMLGMESFEWSAMKKYMNWRGDGSRLKIFDHKLSERFVVIGFYFDEPNSMTKHFIGDLYKY